MRAGVIAHGGAADFVVDHRVHFVADVNWLLGDDAMRAHSLHGIRHAFNFGDDGVVIFAVEPANIADLSAGIGVERRVIEYDFAALARLQLLARRLPVPLCGLMMASTSQPVDSVLR